MFREMLRKKQALTEEECIRILKEEPRGVLSVLGDDGYPYGMPLNHYYCEEDGKIYFHCSPSFRSISPASGSRNPKICRAFFRRYLPDKEHENEVKSPRLSEVIPKNRGFRFCSDTSAAADSESRGGSGLCLPESMPVGRGLQ